VLPSSSLLGGRGGYKVAGGREKGRKGEVEKGQPR
jgi:hypothetical protein